MKQMLYAVALSIAALAISADVSAHGQHTTGRASCPPAPCCTKTVEVKVPARKIVDCTCSWECPSDCVTQGSDYVINAGN